MQALSEKARLRNPDEFYFGMENARTSGGVQKGRRTEANKYSHDELLLMKTQDMKYLEVRQQREKRKLEKLKSNLHLVGAAPVNKHTIFLDSRSDTPRQ